MSATTTADVVVIGAGIVGAASAFRFAQEGYRVVVLERGAANREGSGTTAGNLHVQAVHVRRPGQVVPLDSRRFLPLQKAASDRWEHVADDLDAEIELTRAGGLTVAESEDQHADLVTKLEWEAAAGIPTELLDGDAARAMMPGLGPTVRAATWCPVDGYANPMLVTPAYLDAAARFGARLYTNQPVRALNRGRNVWRVETDSHVVEAPVVLNVAGPWMADIAALAGVALRMMPVAIQMHATVRSPPVLRHLVQHIGEGLSVKQVAAGNVLIGGGWPAGAIDLTGRTRVRVASTVGNLAQALRILPVLRDLRLLRMWAGPLAATADEMPVVGELPGADGLFVAGGTYAFTFAPLWADTLVALVDGSPVPVTLDGLTPERLVATGSIRFDRSRLHLDGD